MSETKELEKIYINSFDTDCKLIPWLEKWNDIGNHKLIKTILHHFSTEEDKKELESFLHNVNLPYYPKYMKFNLEDKRFKNYKIPIDCILWKSYYLANYTLRDYVNNYS